MANFPDGSIAVPLNPAVRASIQDRTLQRTYRDALMPRTMFRMESLRELWAQNLGQTSTFSRRALIEPSTRPVVAGTDPPAAEVEIEQWDATASKWGRTIDTHMPTSYVTLASQYLSNMHALGVQSGMSVNRVVRDKLYNAYTAGNTVVDVAQTSTNTTLHVKNLSGFTRKLFNGRQELVSSTNPLTVTVVTASGNATHQVTGFTSDIAGDEIHGGTLTITPALAANVAARAAIVALNASQVVYSGGGLSIDDLGSSDKFTLGDIRTAVAQLRFANVPQHEDNAYHFHLDPFSEGEIFSDAEFQNLNRGLPDYLHYRRFVVGFLLGCSFLQNNECPQVTTCSEDPNNGQTHGFELVNGAGLQIHRAILTGQGAIEEKYLDESRYISEAGIQVMTEGVRLILRAPIDRFQEVVAATWSISGDWPVPTDELSRSSKATYKRAVVCAHV